MHDLHFINDFVDIEQEYPYHVRIHFNYDATKDELVYGFISLNTSARDLYDALSYHNIDYRISLSTGAYDHNFQLKSLQDVLFAKMLWNNNHGR